MEKQLSVKQIIDEEKRIVQERFHDDMKRVQDAALQQMRGLEQQTAAVKNKNEKL